MKVKQELVSLVTLELRGEEELIAWGDFYINENVSYKLDSCEHVGPNSYDYQIYVKLSDFPKIQRFVRNYKKSS